MDDLATISSPDSLFLPRVHIENISYMRKWGSVYCLILSMERTVFPRSVLAIHGLPLEVSLIEIPDKDYRKLFIRTAVCIPSSFRILRQNPAYGSVGHLSFTFEYGSQVSRLETGTFRMCSPVSSICIPSSVEAISSECFCDCQRLSTVFFEGDSKLSRIEDSVFLNCSSLSSICIPASVEILCSNCLGNCIRLRRLAFESGSRLSRIEGDAFSGCSSLWSLWIPSQLAELSDYALRGTKFRDILIEEGNTCFDVWNDFLFDFELRSVRFHFGEESAVTIPSFAERLAVGCFSGSTILSTVVFEDGCGISEIGDSLFANRSSLISILIPSSIQTLGSSCFYRCRNLSTVIFAFGSKLSRIAESAFAYCSSLSSICIPSSVETLDAKCFSYCIRLVYVTIEPDSKLRRVDPSAFASCPSLSSIRIPSTLDRSCFVRCDSLLIQVQRFPD
jgi:hypothetical protein